MVKSYHYFKSKVLRTLFRTLFITYKQLISAPHDSIMLRDVRRVDFRHYESLPKILQWREQEPEWTIISRKPSTPDLYLKLHKKLLIHWEYKKEQHDYWKPTTETMETLTGDCEDFAILLMRQLYEQGYANEVSVVVTQNHAFCCLGNHIMLDNGHLTYFPVSMNYYSGNLEPLFAFDRTSQWSFEVRNIRWD